MSRQEIFKHASNEMRRKDLPSLTDILAGAKTSENLRESRSTWNDFSRNWAEEHDVRGKTGELSYRSGGPQIIGSPGANTKTDKDKNVLTASLTLQPDVASGVANTCECSTAGCRAACFVGRTGKLAFDTTTASRQLKTEFAAKHPSHFKAILGSEVERLGPNAKADKNRANRFRLGVGDDIRWEEAFPEMLSMHRPEDLAFYAYTKYDAVKRQETMDKAGIENLHLTQSAKETSAGFHQMHRAMEAGINVAAAIPNYWGGKTKTNPNYPEVFKDPISGEPRPSFEMDSSDNRVDDPHGRRHGTKGGVGVLSVKASSKAEYEKLIRGGFVFDPGTGRPMAETLGFRQAKRGGPYVPYTDEALAWVHQQQQPRRGRNAR